MSLLGPPPVNLYLPMAPLLWETILPQLRLQITWPWIVALHMVPRMRCLKPYHTLQHVLLLV